MSQTQQDTLSYTITGDGATAMFPVRFSYLDRSHVLIYLDGEDVRDAVEWVNSGTVKFGTPPAAGAVILFDRATPADEPLVEFTDGSTLTGADLMTQTRQSLMVVEEAKKIAANCLSLNTANNWDVRGLRIINVGKPKDPKDAINKEYAEQEMSAMVHGVMDEYMVEIHDLTDELKESADPQRLASYAFNVRRTKVAERNYASGETLTLPGEYYPRRDILFLAVGGTVWSPRKPGGEETGQFQYEELGDGPDTICSQVRIHTPIKKGALIDVWVVTSNYSLNLDQIYAIKASMEEYLKQTQEALEQAQAQVVRVADAVEQAAQDVDDAATDAVGTINTGVSDGLAILVQETARGKEEADRAATEADNAAASAASAQEAKQYVADIIDGDGQRPISDAVTLDDSDTCASSKAVKIAYDAAVAAQDAGGSADKLVTARTIALSGGATGTATAFDGSADITIPVTGLDIGAANAGVLPAAHGGTGRNDGAANKLGTPRTIAISGGATGTATAFDGSANISIPITGLDVGKANAGILPPQRGGTGRTDGTVAAADRLATPRTITLTGDVTGSTSFDGSGNISIAAVAHVSNGREYFDSDTTLYMTTSGKDGNTGLDSASPLKTWPGVLERLGHMDLGGHKLTVKLDFGTYTEPIVLDGPVVPGLAGSIQVAGADATGRTKIMTSARNAIEASNGAILRVKDMYVEGNAAASAGYYASKGGVLLLQNYNSVGGKGLVCFQAENGGWIDSEDAAYTHIGGAWNFGIIAGFQSFTGMKRVKYFSASFAEQNIYAYELSRVAAYNLSGDATGQRFKVAGLSMVTVGGAGQYAIPGTIDGFIQNGSLYV